MYTGLGATGLGTGDGRLLGLSATSNGFERLVPVAACLVALVLDAFLAIALCVCAHSHRESTHAHQTGMHAHTHHMLSPNRYACSPWVIWVLPIPSAPANTYACIVLLAPTSCPTCDHGQKATLT